MAEKLLTENEETAVAEEPAKTAQVEAAPEVAVDELDAMRASIQALEEKEALLTEKLCIAKEMGLTQQAEKCRELLRTVVLQKNVKKGELQEAEARRAAGELDSFTAELEKELLPQAITDEQQALQYNYLAKAKRTSLVAKIIGFVGVFSCFAGALVYLILSQPEVLNIPFEWLYLAAVGAGAVVFFIISLMINSNAKKYAALAAEIEAEKLENERLIAEQLKADALALDRLRAATEANDAEAGKDAAKKKTAKKIGNIELPQLPEISDDMKKKIHKIAPFAAAGAAVVTVAAVAQAQKKSAAIKRSAALRREFFNWLG